MLAGNFYHITSLHHDNGKIGATLEINAKHKIFEGHFPGQPVVPGVCMVQMVKEILEFAISRETRLVSTDNFKFLSVIDPAKNNIIKVELSYSYTGDERINLTASLVNASVTYFKMNGAVFYLPNGL